MKILIALFLSCCLDAESSPAPAEPRPATTPRFLSLQVLEALPHVRSVKVTPAKAQRKRQILHILDYHFVEEETFATDIRDAAKADGVTLSDEAVAADWEDFVGDVEAVQAEQTTLLRSLAKSHRLKAVHLEGITPERLAGFRRLVRLLRDFKKPRRDSAFTDFLVDMHRNDVLMVGAVGQLMMTGELDVLPVEDQKLYDAANPVKDGKVKFDETAIERREDAIVRDLLASELPVTVLVLGGTHDLADNLKRAGVDDVEYVRLEVNGYGKAVEE